MTKYLIILISFLSVNTYALTNKELFQKINDNYFNLKSFEVELVYRLYKGHRGTEIMDSYHSTFRREGKRSYRNIYGDEIISGEEIGLIVNHELQNIRIVPADQEELFDQNFQESWDYCQNVIIKDLAEGKNITVFFKPHPNLAYSRIDLVIDNDYWVSKMAIFYSTRLNFSKDYFNPQHDVSRLEIDYKSLRKSWKDTQGLTNTEKYVIKEGDHYVTTSIYKTYELIQ